MLIEYPVYVTLSVREWHNVSIALRNKHQDVFRIKMDWCVRPELREDNDVDRLVKENLDYTERLIEKISPAWRKYVWNKPDDEVHSEKYEFVFEPQEFRYLMSYLHDEYKDICESFEWPDANADALEERCERRSVICKLISGKLMYHADE